MTTNNNATATATAGGFPILGLLGVIFIVLKLNPGGHLDSPVEDWSWWLVLLPFYIWIPILLLVIAVGFLVVGIGHLLDKRDERKRRKANADRLRRNSRL